MLYYRILAKENANISNRNLYSFDSSRLLWHLLWLDGKNWHNTYYKKKRILLRNYYFVEKSTLKRLKILPVGGRPWCKGSDPPECTQVPHKGGQAPVTRKVNKKEKITAISKSLLRWFKLQIVRLYVFCKLVRESNKCSSDMKYVLLFIHLLSIFSITLR